MSQNKLWLSGSALPRNPKRTAPISSVIPPLQKAQDAGSCFSLRVYSSAVAVSTTIK